MAFLWNRQKREQLPTSGIDDKDFVQAGIVYNVTFLGSILVPTPTGHGSSRTATAVEKVYLEKYKAFGYGAKKVGLEVSVDEVKVIAKNGGSDSTVSFQTTTITYFNLDLKHDKAFVFVVGDDENKSYRAYVFHCDSPARAREVLMKFKEAFKMKETKSEEMRIRSLSLPCSTRETSHHDDKGADDWSGFEEGRAIGLRPRSQTDNCNKQEVITFGDQNADRHGEDKLAVGNLKVSTSAKKADETEDEFTMLAEKRLRSFDDQAMPGTFEDKLLLNLGAEPPKNTLLQYGGGDGNGKIKRSNSKGSKSFESENLLEL